MQNKVSLVIQGPLHQHSLLSLDSYVKLFDNIIVSHWSTDKLQPTFQHPNVTYLANSPEYPSTTFNCFNTWYHYYSTLQGITSCNSEYVIKVRSDNFIGNLQPAIDKILEFPEKVVVSNLYFRPDNAAKYCPSDQVIGGKTAFMATIFKNIIWRLENQSAVLRAGFNDGRQLTNENYLFKDFSVVHSENASEKMPQGTGVSPEVLFGTSAVYARFQQYNVTRSAEQMRDTFEVIRLEEMLPYVGKDGTSMIPHSGPEIHNINDL